jgi:L-asparaginase
MPEAPLPRIAVLATGGTIAGVQRAPGTSGYDAGVLGADALVAAVPGLERLARISTEQVASVGSQDMSLAIWHKLAERVRELDADPDIAGIVVTHGTDTLEETACFLDLVTAPGKPLVLTAAMRPATALGADGPANLYASVALAADASAAGRGPLVLLNDEIHAAREVQKISASALHAFASPNRGRAGHMEGRRPRFHVLAATAAAASSGRAPPSARYPVAELPPAAQWPRVGIVYAHAGLQADVITYMASCHAGLVLAGTGGGTASSAAIGALAAAVRGGVAVVRASRIGQGVVRRDIEVDDTACGFVAAGDLPPAKARILLMLALTRTQDAAALQDVFDRY